MVKSTRKDLGNRPGTAVQRKGRERVEQILDSATELLIQEGYGQFTMNQLSSRLGIRLSNLQYYFPSREQLIHKLLQRYLQTGLQDIATVTSENTPPRKRLLAMIDHVLKEQESESACKIFWELWALSARDDKINQTMDEFYKNYTSTLCEMMSALNPEIPARKMNRIAILVVSMIEGLSLMRGFGKQRHSDLRGIEKELRETLLRMIDA
jgi:AcrR family transcriptional regulator